MTVAPDVPDKLPASSNGGLCVQVPEPSENVSSADSPTPSLVRARLEGTVATVSDVILALAQGQGRSLHPPDMLEFPVRLVDSDHPVDGPRPPGAVGGRGDPFGIVQDRLK